VYGTWGLFRDYRPMTPMEDAFAVSRDAGNPHVRFEVEGAGDGVMGKGKGRFKQLCSVRAQFAAALGFCAQHETSLVTHWLPTHPRVCPEQMGPYVHSWFTVQGLPSAGGSAGQSAGRSSLQTQPGPTDRPV